MNMKRALYSASLIFAILAIGGCSGTYKSRVDFDRDYPIRVAVLPFVQVNSSGEIVDDDGSIVLDVVPTFADTVKQSPPVFIRNLVQTELANTTLDVVTPAIVDINLSHSDMTKPASLDFDLAKVMALKPADVCTRILSCDAVMYGKVTRWDRGYYGIQAVNTVGVELKMVSAKTGKVLFESTAKDSDGRGLLKGPTGFSDLVIAPITGLDSKVITDLARRVVAKAVDPLRAPAPGEANDKAPPTVFSATHDAFSGTLGRKQVLTVLVYGTSASTGSFSIGNSVRDIPLIERSPGHYVGEYHPAPNDQFIAAPVTVTLVDKWGRRANQLIGRGEITLQ